MIQVLSNLPPDTEVGILTFVDWIYPIAPIDRDKLTGAIRATRAGGGTPLGAYMKTACDTLLEQREKYHGYGTFRLLVVTDGEASDPNVLAKYLPDIVSRGITLDTIGVDMREDHTLGLRSRKYMKADDPDSLTKAVSASLAEVAGTSDDRNAQENFDAIQGIPDKMVKNIITSLTDQPNQPIGEEAPVKVIDENGNVKLVKSSAATTDSGWHIGWWIGGGGVAVLLIVILIVVGATRMENV